MIASKSPLSESDTPLSNLEWQAWKSTPGTELFTEMTGISPQAYEEEHKTPASALFMHQSFLQRAMTGQLVSDKTKIDTLTEAYQSERSKLCLSNEPSEGEPQTGDDLLEVIMGSLIKESGSGSDVNVTDCLGAFKEMMNGIVIPGEEPGEEETNLGSILSELLSIMAGEDINSAPDGPSKSSHNDE